jgi:hypothetical protein
LKNIRTLFCALILCSLGVNALAQNINWRGTIASFDGKTLGVSLRDGSVVVVDVPESLPISATERFSLADVKPGMVLGVTTVQRADGATVASTNAHELVLNYKTGTVKVVVPADTPMSRAVPGARSDLVLGEAVYVASRRNEAQDFTAVRVQVGKNGVKPTQ